MLHNPFITVIICRRLGPHLFSLALLLGACTASSPGNPVSDAAAKAPDVGSSRMPVCGNGVIEPPERCDPGFPASSAKSCPRACDETPRCTVGRMLDENTCQARCIYVPLETCSGENLDGCCPIGCDRFSDRDCQESLHVALGPTHSCSITGEGSLYCWGDNALGQLGDTTNQDRESPVAVEAGSPWQAIAGGRGFTCGIKQEGTLWCWGQIPFGDKASDEEVPSYNRPQPMGSQRDWASLVCGEKHCCGLKKDQTLWCGGDNAHGQLGRKTIPDVAPGEEGFYSVAAQKRWKSLVVGEMYNCSLSTTGNSLWCWGSFQLTGHQAPPLWDPTLLG
jgi:hypothetical protein